MKHIQLLSLIAILFIGSILRFYQLGHNPPSLTWDEVAWGYNAYSIGIDGKDEFGRFLPYDYLESFGDFKPPVYAYLTVFPVKLFGLSEFSTRFASAFFGVLTVVITFYLAKGIFPNSTESKLGKISVSLPLISAFVLAISPWHVNLSRAAFEANVATFFLATGVCLFLWWVQSVNEHKKYSALRLIFSGVFFIITLYTFNTPRIVAPLLVFALGIGFWKTLLQKKGHCLLAFVVAGVLLFPTIRFLTSEQARLRFHEVNIFSDVSVVTRSNQEIKNDQNAWWSKILHNRRLIFTTEFFKHYFDHFSPQFLFIRGDGNPKFSTQDVGQLYMWELPFLIAGIIFLFKKREGHWWIIPVWLVLGIIPAATARETPHALRIETTLPTWQLLVAYGFVQCVVAVKEHTNKVVQNIFALATLTVILMNCFYYVYNYYVYYPAQYASEWQYGYKDAISYITTVKDSYDRIYITTAMGRPYAYVLFYMQTDPLDFRKTKIVEREALGFVKVKRFGKYVFTDDVNREQSNEKILYINTPSQVPNSAHVLRTFRRPDGEVALIAYTR